MAKRSFLCDTSFVVVVVVCGIIAEPKRIAETEIYLNAFMILRLISDRELLKVTTFSV